MLNFDPNQPGIQGNLFGLPFGADEADLVLLPVPWDVTASYGQGAVNGPRCILDASPQIDYLIPGIFKPWKLKVAMLEIDQSCHNKSVTLRKEAEEYIQWFEKSSGTSEKHFLNILNGINRASKKLNQWVYDKALNYLGKGKIIGTIGGDHSTPLGLISALSKNYNDFGVLQIDAHMDLRQAYEGFQYSHASIMFNVLQNRSVSRLVQVGIRDYCEEEETFAAKSDGRVKTFFDASMKEMIHTGGKWADLCDVIIEGLPKHVYLSFDIDGLDPGLCPGTGTPVPGGLSFTEATYLIKKLVKSGRKIIGFDLSEVGPSNDQWDGNVAARILYHICAYTGLSQGKLKFEE